MNRNEWRTPRAFFQPYHDVYKFTVDAAASDWNAMLPRYWTEKDNGLAQSWYGERVWCNPPYGRGLIEPWVDKALTEFVQVAVLLLPVRTSTAWFQRLWEQHSHPAGVVHLVFPSKRIKFEPPEGVTASSPMEDNLVVTIRRTA